MRREVFISYSTKDRQTAYAMCASLEAQGISCWIAPRDIMPSKIWAEAIIEALNECRVMVLILSANANESRQVWREAQLADDVNITIVPFRIEDVPPSKTLKFFLGLQHWLDALTPPLEYHLQFLVETLRQLIPPLKEYDLPLLEPVQLVTGVFDRHGQLNTNLFAFHVGDLLLRAAFRRNRQHRKHVSLTDFLYGLLSIGDLTRYLLRQRKLKLDDLAANLLDRIETEGGAHNNGNGATADESEDDWLENFDPDTADEEQKQAFLAKFIVRDRNDFTEHLAKHIEAAWRNARARVSEPGQERISEQDILEGFIADPAWLQQAALGLPNAVEMLHLLRERERVGEVDENGVLSIIALAPAAQSIIDNAHKLAQEHGMFPIPNRMLLAAFLKSESAYAADLFRQHKYDAEAVLENLLSTSTEESLSFALSVEACARIVLPVIEEAKKITAQDSLVTEPDLFKAFCRKALPEFKAWLRESAEGIDLDRLDGDEVEMTDEELELVRQQIKEFIARWAAPYHASVDVKQDVVPWLIRRTQEEGSDIRYLGMTIEQHIKTPLMIALARLKGARSVRLILVVAPNKLRIECHRHESDGNGNSN